MNDHNATGGGQNGDLGGLGGLVDQVGNGDSNPFGNDLGGLAGLGGGDGGGLETKREQEFGTV
jgi:hypothetical protein